MSPNFESGVTKMLKHLIAIALVAVSSLANANEFAIRTTKEFVRFSVPDDWRVLSVQTKPPVSVATFQVGNPADEGTPHSTNVAVSLFHIGTERGQAAAAAVGRSYGPVAPVSSTVDSGAVYIQQPTQRGLPYLLIDAKKPFADVIVALRFAWPNLSNNPSNHDSTMRGAFEAVRRPAQSHAIVPASRHAPTCRDLRLGANASEPKC